jgi:hypothetical protein
MFRILIIDAQLFKRKERGQLTGPSTRLG